MLKVKLVYVPTYGVYNLNVKTSKNATTGGLVEYNVILTRSNQRNMTKTLKPKNTEERKSKTGITYVVVPPDGGWGWVIVAASFVCNFVAEGTMYSYGLFLQDIAEGLGTTPTNVSLANSLMSGFYFFFGPVICAMINRWGYRVVGFTGGIIATISFVAASFVPSVIYLIVSYGLIGGIGFGMLYMPSVIAIGFYFEKWRGVANSVSLCGSAVGSISIPIVITISMKGLDWRNKFRCFSGFAFFCALCTLLYKPLHPLEVTVDEKPETSTKEEDEEDYDDLLPYRAALNKLNNQGFRRMSVTPKPQGSFYSIRRAGSANAFSSYSFKSYTSTTRSLFKGSRMTNAMGNGCCATCCDTENCKHTCMLLCCCWKRCKANPARPLYRDDILYTGSVAYLPEYRNMSFVDPLDFHISMTRVPDEKDLDQDTKCCVCCPHAIRRPLATMLDFGMFKSGAFTLVALSGFLTLLGFFIPLMYITEKAIKHGMEKEMATYLLSTFGFAHLVGRIACAIINFFPSIKALPVSTIFIFVAGLSTIVSVYLLNMYVQFGFSAAYGFSFAMILSLRPIMIVELFGLEKLSNSFGIMMMFYGMACLMGIPIAGLLYNKTLDYNIPFLFAGGSIVLSGIFLAIVPPVVKQERRRAARRRRKELLMKHQRARTSKGQPTAKPTPKDQSASKDQPTTNPPKDQPTTTTPTDVKK